MKRKTTCIAFALLALLMLTQNIPNVYSQKSKNKSNSEKEEVIATVGSEKITFGELEKAYQKNMNRKNVMLSHLQKDSLMDFLNLYIKYRLKVNDALGRAFDKDSSVQAEIAQNRKILAESFFLDKKLIEPNVEHLAEMRKIEMKVAVILFLFENKGAENDTLSAYNKAISALDSLRNGSDFGQLAFNLSDDKEFGKNKGVIPAYKTAGQIQKPIEDAIYAIKKVGDYYPYPVKTKFGYFLVKLIDRIPRIKVKGSHILLSFKEGVDSLLVYKKADSLTGLLKSGSSFDKLAEINSDDPSSALKGGSLGSYYSRSSGFEANGKNVISEFEDALFLLKDGEISKPVKTDYGLHIIRRDSTKSFDMDSEKDELRKLYKRIYFDDDKKVFIDSLRNHYGFIINETTLKMILNHIDTTKSNIDASWQDSVKSFNSDKLYSLMNQKTDIEGFIAQAKKNPELKAFALTDRGFRQAIDKITEPQIFADATKNLEKQYPEFESLMKEFRDGILLFKVEALEVWDKLKFDSVLARKYYDTTQTRYKTEPKYDISEIYVLTDSLAKTLYQQARTGEDFGALAENNTQRAGYREKKGNWGLVTVKKNKLAEIAQFKAMKVGDVLEPQKYEKGFSIIKLNAFEPVRQKTFEEAISDFAPEFQDIVQKNLTEQWLMKVRQKYPVNIEEKKIDKILSNK
ncbi:MAG: hypothetical protein QG635_478 [Bacteroidota bacterium]|nr:hypothetical protein [Bacteroidota bacterium]